MNKVTCDAVLTSLRTRGPHNTERLLPLAGGWHADLHLALSWLRVAGLIDFGVGLWWPTPVKE